jgi:mannonate dehydratase
MNFDLSRRSLIVRMGSTAVVSAGLPALVKVQTGRTQESFSVGMPKEGPDTPKLAAPLDARSITDQSMRAVKQLGVDHVLMGGPPMPWTQPQLRAIVDRCRTGGLVVGNMMIGGFPDTIYGRPGREGWDAND